MRTFVPQTVLLMAGLVWISGCANSQPSAPVPKLQEATGVAPSAAPEPAKSNDASSSSKPKVAAKTPEKKSAVPENADPKTVFVISSIGDPMDVVAEDGLIPEIKYDVAFADASSNSTNYTLDSIGQSTQPQSLIGKGTPKAGFTLPKGFTEYKPLGYDASGLPLRIICTKTGTQLALVPAGTSIVGTDRGPDESTPAFTVSLDSFYMEVMEDTVRDYEKYRAEMREKKKPIPPAPSNLGEDPDFPALGVSWSAAQGYVRWAGMELPTEAEYEKAARGPKGLRTPWGDGKPLWGVRGLSKIGSYQEDTSPFGILDLAGNAREWTTDLYSPSSHSEAAAAAIKETLRNWAGPKKVKEMNLRVVKGNGPDWSAWHRDGMDTQKANNDVGFRGVLRITPEGKSGKTKDDSKSSTKAF